MLYPTSHTLPYPTALGGSAGIFRVLGGMVFSGRVLGGMVLPYPTLPGRGISAFWGGIVFSGGRGRTLPYPTRPRDFGVLGGIVFSGGRGRTLP